MNQGLWAAGRLAPLVGRVRPARAAFAGSTLLSVLAIVTGGTLNRDGMLYVDAARMFLADGLAATHAVFGWPFLPVLMAAVSQLTGLGLENAGYLLNVLFMAGACALLVACSARLLPEAAWPICLALLAIPGLNDYRHEVLREYGCWFFVMLSFWLALRWSERPRWRSVLPVHAALVAAALFRPEALALFPALILWQASDAPAAERWRRLAMIGALPVAGLATLVAMSAADTLPGRLAADLGHFSPERFLAKARQLEQVLPEYARGQAATILFFGSLAIIPVKFVKMMGVFNLPLLFPCAEPGEFRAAIGRARLFAWAFLAHLLVLMVFVTDLHFLAGRYMAALLLFVVPFAGYGLWRLFERFPRWRAPVVLVSILIALSNVVSTSPGKHHFVAAGQWLAANAQDSPRVYVESARSAYYAGWRFSARPAPEVRRQLTEGLRRGDYDLVVLEVSRKEAAIAPWLAASGLREIVRFTHPNRDAVVIAEPQPRQAQDSASNTSRMREKTGSIE